MTNVLKGIVELGRQADYRNPIWVMKLNGHSNQLEDYLDWLYEMDIEPNIHVDGSLRPCKLMTIHTYKYGDRASVEFVFLYGDSSQHTVPAAHILDIKSVPPPIYVPMRLRH